MLKRTMVLLFAVGCLGVLADHAQAQALEANPSANASQEHLKGLRKASPGELDFSKPFMIDGESIPVYSEAGKRLRGTDLEQAMRSGLMPDFYVDERKDVKAIVLRIVSAEERNQMQAPRKMQEGKTDLIGQVAKTFSLKDLDGNEFSLDLLKGKIIVMNFWFVACKPCAAEMPELNKLVEEYKGRDIVFLGFATDEETKVRSFLEKHKFAYHIIPGSADVVKSYGIDTFPTHIVVDQEARIIYVGTGGGMTTVSDLKAAIGKLLKGSGKLT